MSSFQSLQRAFFIASLFILLFAGKCNRGYRAIQAQQAKEQAEQKIKDAAALRTKNLINTIRGISYTEVRRRFDNGLSFSPVGYQLVPEWRITFPSRDSVTIFSPKKNKFLNAPVVFDHDSIFSVAWAWLKLRYLTKDSLQFMVLHVNDRVIIDEKVHVYMTFYSNDYIKNVLHSDTNKLWRPGRSDTLYIKSKVLQSRQIRDSAFAGTSPPILKSRSPLVSVKKENVPDEVDGGKPYDAYLSPTYDIQIRHAYQDFYYSFTAWVNEKGEISFRKNLLAMSPEFQASTIATLKAITDGYLKLYIDARPAKTLGIAHNSIIFLNVQGFKKR